MKNKSIIFTFLFFLVGSLALFASENPAQLRLHLVPGETMNQQYKVSAEINANSQRTLSDTSFKMHYRVEKNSEEGILILATPYYFSFLVELGNDKIQIFSKEAIPEIIEGQALELTLSPRGKVIKTENIDGCKEALKQLLASSKIVKNGKPARFTDLDRLIDEYFTVLMVGLGGFAEYCPENAVDVGNSWVSPMHVLTFDGNHFGQSSVSVDFVSKCKEKKDGQLLILCNLLIAKDSNDDNPDLDWSILSSFWIDEKTGWLNEAELSYQGESENIGISVEMNLFTKKISP